MASNKIWTPNSNSGSHQKVTLKGEIITAQYHKDLGQIAVALVTEDGQRRSGVLYASNFLFGGKPPTEVPQEDVDREMEKTAELFRQRRGATVKLEIYEQQV